MVTNYSGYNPDPSKGMVGASWDGGGYNTTVGNYTISGPIPTETWVNPDFDWAKAYTDATTKKPTDDTDKKDTTPAEDPYTAYLKAEQARLEALRVMNAKAIMEAQMTAYGLGALAARITGWIQQGYEPDAIMALVRQSDEYAARFPAMKALQAKGRSITESEYIAYEQSMASYERMFGLPSGMLTDKNMVTKLLTNEVSAREVEDRATKAAASMYALPQEFRDTMRRYYGVDSGGLTGYFLDPDVAAPLLERQYVSAQIGMEGTMNGLTVDKALVEALYERGVDAQEARQGMQRAGQATGLMAGKGDTVTQESLVKGTFGVDATATTALERAGSSRRGRFEGGGQFAGDRQGARAIGSS